MKQGRRAIEVAKAVVLVTPVVLLLWMFNRYLALDGELTIEYDFNGESSYVSEFTPLGRAWDREENLRTGETYQRIVGEPVYMSVDVPWSFDEVEMTVEYQNRNQPFIQFGLVKTTDPWVVDLKPAEISAIDTALAEWDAVEEDGVTLLQKERSFETFGEFVTGFPEDASIGYYNYFPPHIYIDDTYEKQAEGTEINRLLRGPHSFATYVKDEPLKCEFTVTDINREEGEDPVSIGVVRDSTILHEELLNDDGVADASRDATGSRTMTIDIPELPEGMYTLVFHANNDIVIESIRCGQHKFVAISHLYLVNSEEYSDAFPEIDTSETILTFHGHKLSARTAHTEGIQTLFIDDQPLDVYAVDAPFWWEEGNASEYHELRVVKNDIQLDAPGFFAFEPEQAFNPLYGLRYVDETASANDFDYILVKEYTPPTKTTSYTYQSATFSLDGVEGDRKSLDFTIAAPGIARNQNELTIHNVSFTFTRDSLWERVKNKFSSDK